jgi:hypothetical protein
VDGATNAAEAAADDAAAAVEAAVEAVETTADSAAADATVAAEAAGDAALAEIFTAEGFDYDRAIAALEASDLAPATRATLAAALQSARDNPALLEAALTQAREALGIAQ